MSIHILGFKTFVSLYIGWSNDGMIQLKPESRERNMGQIGKIIATLYRRKCQPKWSFSKGKSFLFAGKSEGCWNFCSLARWLEVGRWILHFFWQVGSIFRCEVAVSLTLRYVFGGPPSWHRTSRGRYFGSPGFGVWRPWPLLVGVFLWDWIEQQEY